ncbi:MAG TPA: Wzz/FepE/Etk N-terminal domain-containing protein, partial [Gemmatimonadaceae bacterium]|nr:Wzz/FepE/Etk N-terminal domain-containing protein [Gemmatimonadaceae bacterium]
MEADFRSLAERALELEKLTPVINHDPSKCEVCAEYQQEYLAFARGAMPQLARAYLEIDHEAIEAGDKAKARAAFIRDLHAETESLQRELTARTKRIEELEHALEVREAAMEHALRREPIIPEPLQRELEARGSRIQELEHDLGGRESELRVLKQELETHKKTVLNLSEELSRISAAHNAANESMQRELDARTARNAELETELEARSTADESQLREMNALRTTVHELRESAVAHDRDGNALREELHASTMRAQELEAEMERRLMRRESEIRQLRQSAADQQAQLDELQRQLDERGAGMATLHHELAEREARIQALQAELVSRASRIEQLTGQVAEREAETQSLQRSVDASTARIEALERDLRQDLSGEREEITSLQRELASRGDRIEQLETELLRLSATAEAERDALERQLNGLKATLEEQRESAAAVSAELAALTDELRSTSQQSTALQAELQRTLAARTSSVDALTRELKTRDATLETLRQEVASGAVRLEQLREQFADRESEVADLRRDLVTRVAKIDHLQAELLHVVSGRDAEEQVLRNELNALRATVRDQLHAAAGRSEEIDDLRNQLQSASSRASALETEVQRRIEAREIEVQDFKRELDTRAARIHALHAELLESIATRPLESVRPVQGVEADEQTQDSTPDLLAGPDVQPVPAAEAMMDVQAEPPIGPVPDVPADVEEMPPVEIHDAAAAPGKTDSNGTKPDDQIHGPEMNDSFAQGGAARPGDGTVRQTSDPQTEEARARSGRVVVAASRVHPRYSDARAGGGMPDPVLTFAQATRDKDDHLSFRQLTLTVRRNRWLILLVTLATIASAVAYNRMARPVYQSSATIRIDDKDAGNALLTGVAAMPGLGGSKIQTEMEVLRSRQLAENVATKLHLNLQVLEPVGARRFIRIVNVPPDVEAVEVMLKRRDATRYEVRRLNGASTVALPEEVQVGVPFSIGRATLALESSSGPRLPDKLTVQLRPLRTSVDALRNALVVGRPQREAQIINIRFENNDPVIAAAVPNLLLDEFIRYKAQTNKTEATSTVGFLRQQVASYEGQLRAAEAALGGFREQARVVSIGDEAQAQVRQMADMQAERDQLESERQSLAAILAKAQRQGTGAARDIAAFPSFITNRAMQDILQSLIQLENQRADLLVRRNPENADVIAASKRISDLEGQLTQMARAYLAGLDSKLTSLNSGVQSFGKRMETIPAKEIAFARLSRDQKLLEDISTLLQTRLKEAEIKEAIQPGDVRGIDRALVPERPTSPKPTRNILFGIFGGLFLAIGAAVAREMLDTRVKTKEDVQSVTGGMPILGAIPRIPVNGNTRPGRKTPWRPATKAVTANGSSGTRIITQGSSRDVFAEAYRALRTNITFAAADHSNQVLVITSAIGGEGKSTTASNLAVTLAQQGVRTLLIDAD